MREVPGSRQKSRSTTEAESESRESDDVMTRDSDFSCSAGDSRAALVAGIRRDLARDGFSVVRGAMPIGSFYHLASRLGSVLRIEDIRLGITRRGAHSKNRLGLHTDQHYVDWIAWYCVRPAERGGETLLVDTAPILARWNAAERSSLSRVTMRCPDVDDRTGATEVPLLRTRGSRDRVYFAAWNVAPLPDREQNAAFKRFAAEVEAAQRTGIRLEAGECLIVDNGRILHGRDELPDDSPRVLRRFWIAARAPD